MIWIVAVVAVYMHIILPFFVTVVTSKLRSWCSMFIGWS